jgi:uncharacterized membrane protein
MERLAGTRHGHEGRAALEERLAIGLGWFGIALGLAELTAPRPLARLIGLDEEDEPTLNSLRALGLREIGSGLGILMAERRAGWMWARVGGDAMDLAFLGAGLRSPEARPERIAMAAAAVAGVTALDVLCGLRRGGAIRGRAPGERGIHVVRTLTVNRSPEEVYRFWRAFENLPRFMRHLHEVRTTADRRSHWRARGPAGTTVEWDAAVTADRPGELIEWRSLEGATVENSGSVRFQRGPGGRGTEVRVELRYQPPAGRLGAAVAWAFGESPGQQIREDLRRYKQLMETGEIARSEASLGRWAHAARPTEHGAARFGR